MCEVWKDIPIYEGLYEASNYGRIRNKRNGKIKIQRDNGRGYQYVNLWKNNKGRNEYVHRMVAMAFIPNPENKPCVDHINTDRADNRVENLQWVTYTENNLNPITNQKMRDSWRYKVNKEETQKTKKKVGKTRKTGLSRREFARQHMIEYNTNRRYKVLCVELDKVFDGTQDAANFIGVDRSNIIRAIKRNGKSGGYHWIYLT